MSNVGHYKQVGPLGGAWIMKVKPLIKDIPESYTWPLSFGDTIRSMQPGNGPSPDLAGFLISDFQLLEL